MKLNFFIQFALAFIGGVLVINSLSLFAQGLFNFGIVLPVVIGVFFGFLAWRWKRVQAWLAGRSSRKKLWYGAWGLFAAWLMSLGLFFGMVMQKSQVQGANVTAPSAAEPQFLPKAIIILGSGTPNCRVSETLRLRLDAGLKQAKLYPAAWVVVSGGKDWRLDCTEAQLMGDYLRTQGLAPARIIQEDASTSTHENIRFTMPLLLSKNIANNDDISIATSDFHTLRSLYIAHRAGLTHVEMVSAATPLYIRYTAWLREYFSFIKGWLLDEY
jgi:uncharacterized SAM-binding protein YcdF (DUF218 family)